MNRFSLFIVALFVAFFAGCTQGAPTFEQAPKDPSINMPYEIMIENGKYYLSLPESIRDDNTSGVSSSELAPSVNFESLAEMVQDIKTGSFTDEELKMITRFKTDDTGKTYICDLSKLYDAYAPEPCALKEIMWTGENYRFDFNIGQVQRCSMVGGWSNSTMDTLKTELIECKYNGDIRLISTTQVEERNATVITYTTKYSGWSKEYRNIYYAIVDGDRELFVFEKYGSSGDAPIMVTILGTENGYNFTVQLDLWGAEERPSVEWLSRFGFREYVETEVA